MTVTLYEQIQADLLDEPAVVVAVVNTAHEVPATTLLEVLGRFAQLQVVIADLQNKVQQGIQTVQEVLKHYAIPVYTETCEARDATIDVQKTSERRKYIRQFVCLEDAPADACVLYLPCT